MRKEAKDQRVAAEQLAITTGEWKSYDRYNPADMQRLIASIKNYSTGWLQEDDEKLNLINLRGEKINIFYSNNLVDPTSPIPRALIASRPASYYSVHGKDVISDILGVKDHFILDLDIISTVEDKLNDFNELSREHFSRAITHMTILYEIEDSSDTELLQYINMTFIYQKLNEFESFYPGQLNEWIRQIRKRIETQFTLRQILEKRFFTTPSQNIALQPEEITETTKIYVGEINGDVIRSLPFCVRHVYQEYPEKEVYPEDLYYYEETPEILESRLKEKDVGIDQFALTLIKTVNQQPDISYQKPTIKHLIRLSLEAMGFTEPPTLTAFYNKTEELKFKLCDPKIVPHLAIQYANNHEKDLDLVIAMNLIDIPDIGFSAPSLYRLNRYLNQFYLDISTIFENPEQYTGWNLDQEFIFEV